MRLLPGCGSGGEEKGEYELYFAVSSGVGHGPALDTQPLDWPEDRGRPTPEDLQQDAAFALEAWDDLQAGWQEFAPPGNHPYKEGGKGGSFVPQTKDTCVHCGLCRRQCPMGAIAEDCTTIDGERCISCFRCVKRCPVKAKGVFTPEYEQFAAAFSERLKEPKENRYFLPRK